jgi:hypothetical protein
VALHCLRVGGGDGAATTAENADVIGVAFPEQIDHFGKELDMSTVVAGKSDGAHILLDRRPHNIAGRTMVTEVDDLDAVADELQVDGVDGAVVAIADRHRGQQTDGTPRKLWLGTVDWFRLHPRLLQA